MEVYIIARYNDARGKGYILIDIDDNNKTKRVSNEALLKAVKGKKIKIQNAKTYYNSISGIYYSLGILPECTERGIVFNNNRDKVVLKELVCENKHKYLTVRVPYYSQQDIEYLDDQSIKHNMHRICNISNKMEILCKVVNVPNAVRTLNDSINEKDSSVNSLSKYKILLAGTKFESLIKDEYINNVKFLYPLLSRVDNDILGDNQVEQSSKLKLDTSKYIELDLSRNNGNTKLGKEITTAIEVAIEETERQGEIEPNSPTDIFIGLSNLITTLSNPDKVLYNKDVMDLIDVNTSTSNFNFIYWDGRYAIIVIYADFCQNVQRFKCDSKIRILGILDKLNILYMTLFSNLFRHKVLNKNFTDVKNRVSCAEYLRSGDEINFNTNEFSVNNCNIPKDLSKLVSIDIFNRVVLLGKSDKHKHDEYGITGGRGLIYVPSAQQFLTVHSVSRNISIHYFSVDNVYKLSEISNIDPIYLEDIKLAFNDNMNLAVLNTIAKAANVKKEACKNEKIMRYDIGKNNDLISLARRIHEVYKGHDYNEMLLDYNMLKQLVRSGLIEDTRGDLVEYNTINFGRKEGIVESFETTATIKTTTKTTIRSSGIKRYDNKFVLLSTMDKFPTTSYIDIIEEDKNGETRTAIYHSIMQFKSLISLLYSIGEHLNDKVSVNRHYVSNIDIDINDFIIIKEFEASEVFSDLYDNPVDMRLAVEKKTGYAFIISNHTNHEDYKVIFRFKNIHDAAVIMYKSSIEPREEIASSSINGKEADYYYTYSYSDIVSGYGYSDEVEWLICDIDSIIKEVYRKPGDNKMQLKEDEGYLYVIREAIILGKDNGSVVSEYGDWLFKMLAKQPRDAIKNK